ncbi:MAG: family 1 glycosylhydrolase [Pseudoxanthomonas sp.]
MMQSADLSRRDLLKLAAATPLLGIAGLAAKTARMPAYPPGFLWGTATAGHQVEGNNTASDMWLLEQVEGTLFAEPSGDACDSLHRWGEDMDIVRSLGLGSYRFSVEWARVEPEEGKFSVAFLDHYLRMVEGCHARGLVPVVTFHHFSSPRWFAARGGWTNADAPRLFARFCQRVAGYFGDGIGHALTFNEPNLPWLGKWSATPMSAEALAMVNAMLAKAAKACGSDKFSLLHAGDPEPMLDNVLQAHRQARAAIKAERAAIQVGLSLALPDDQAVGRNSRIAEKRKQVYEPFFDAGRDDDFIGVQTYNRSRIDAKGTLPKPAGAESTQVGDEFYPAALGGAIRYAHRATGKPVLVTENGIAATDDALRQRFLPAALQSMDAAIADGVPVLGYLHWSLLDNFEWLAGYGPKFGLVAVDRSTFKRTPKPSAALYAELVKARSP